jgi:hypothetical protein
MEHMSGWKVTTAPTCPHCKAEMEQLDARHLDWDSPYLWVCFNDECTLFKKGWEQMMEKFGQMVSYRFMIHPQDGQTGVIPAFSHDYLSKNGKPANPNYSLE